MICGFVFLPGGGTAKLVSPSEAASPAADVAATDPFWLHFNLADNRARRWIAECVRLPPAAREVLLDEDARIHLRPAGRGLAGVLGDLHHAFDREPEGLGVFRLYVDDACVVTGRSHPLKTMDRLRQEAAGGLDVSSPIHLMTRLLEDLAEMFGEVVADLADAVDRIEDQILKGLHQDEGAELGRVRRLLVRLRRHVGADRQALSRALPRLPAWCGEADSARLRSAVEMLESVGQDLELVQERSRLLQEEIAARVGEATNRNLYTLSIFTAIFLPVTLVTGIFGMNVGGLPWLDDPAGFWWAMFLIVATAAVVLLALYWRRFF